MPELKSTRDHDGVRFAADGLASDWLRKPYDFQGADALRVSLLAQLEGEGRVDGAGSEVLLPWDAVYFLEDGGYEAADRELLSLPPIRQWRPILDSNGTLSDPEFAITISGWIDEAHSKHLDGINVDGAVIACAGTETLPPHAAWQTLKALRQFHGRPKSERSTESNKKAWAAIRLHAIAARADLSRFLASTVVLTPERLKLSLRQAGSGSGKVVEVIPGFESQPRRWLEIFDRIRNVPERYEIPDGEGLVHVLVSPQVRTVLTEIKRMPGRRIAGDRAQAFLRNPFALLGPDARTAIDADEFEAERKSAGITFSRFLAHVRHDERTGLLLETGLLIEDATHGTSSTIKLLFASPESLNSFVIELSRKLRDKAECCLWEGYELELLGDTPDQLSILQKALGQWRNQFAATVPCDVSPRIEQELGVEKPYSSIHIERRSTLWPPDDVDIWITVTGTQGPVLVQLPRNISDVLEQELEIANLEQRDTIQLPGCSEPIPRAQAQEILDVLKQAQESVRSGTSPAEGAEKLKRLGLVVKPNVNQIDYSEERGSLTIDLSEPLKLAASLRPEIALKPHQTEGVRWLQHLYRHSPLACRGCLLADDMGLGKTVQVLAFVLRCIEDDAECDPFLIVAPASLLDNWTSEIRKFFNAEHIPILALYGKTLARLRATSSYASMPSGNLLVPHWRGDAKIVLTTYETLRDLEFSLALQKWSAMVCDEAQKIRKS